MSGGFGLVERAYHRAAFSVIQVKIILGSERRPEYDNDIRGGGCFFATEVTENTEEKIAR